MQRYIFASHLNICLVYIYRSTYTFIICISHQDLHGQDIDIMTYPCMFHVISVYIMSTHDVYKYIPNTWIESTLTSKKLGIGEPALLSQLCWASFVEPALVRQLCWASFAEPALLSQLCWASFVGSALISQICWANFDEPALMSYLYVGVWSKDLECPSDILCGDERRGTPVHKKPQCQQAQ